MNIEKYLKILRERVSGHNYLFDEYEKGEFEYDYRTDTADQVFGWGIEIGIAQALNEVIKELEEDYIYCCDCNCEDYCEYDYYVVPDQYLVGTIGKLVFKGSGSVYEYEVLEDCVKITTPTGRVTTNTTGDLQHFTQSGKWEIVSFTKKEDR